MPIDRDTFMQVRQHVIETAPAGLSKAQFDALLDQEIAKVGAPPPAAPARPVAAGGRGTGLDVRQSGEFAQGVGSLVPGLDVEAPDTWRGKAGRVTGEAALLAYPAAKIGAAAFGGEGVPLVGRGIAAAREAMAQASPMLKYEVAKATMERMGIPSPVAIPLAMAISGYKRGAKPAAARAATTAAETEAATVARAGRPASSPVAPAPPAASAAAAPLETAAPVPAPSPAPASPRVVMSPQRIQNELGLAARRSQVALTEPEYAQAADLVARQGLTPVEAVARMKTLQPAPQPSAGAVPASAPALSPEAQLAKLRLNGAESQAYIRLTRRGMSHPEAVQAIEQQRELAKMLGTPESETVRTAVKDRNATGRWGKTK